jgi:hypothetical protein
MADVVFRAVMKAPPEAEPLRSGFGPRWRNATSGDFLAHGKFSLSGSWIAGRVLVAFGIRSVDDFLVQFL